MQVGTGISEKLEFKFFQSKSKFIFFELRMAIWSEVSAQPPHVAHDRCLLCELLCKSAGCITCIMHVGSAGSETGERLSVNKLF